MARQGRGPWPSSAPGAGAVTRLYACARVATARFRPPLWPGLKRRHRRGAPPACGVDFRNPNPGPAAARFPAQRTSTAQAETAAPARRGSGRPVDTIRRVRQASRHSARMPRPRNSSAYNLQQPHSSLGYTHPYAARNRLIGCFCLSSGGPVPEGRSTPPNAYFRESTLKTTGADLIR